MMRLLIVSIVLISPVLGEARQAPSADEAAVREVVRRYQNAREAKDPAVIESLFTADADQHISSGEWRRGRAEVVPGTLDSSNRNPGRRSIKVSSVRFITSDVAIADGPYDIDTGTTVRHMWTTIVLKRRRHVADLGDP